MRRRTECCVGHLLTNRDYCGGISGRRPKLERKFAQPCAELFARLHDYLVARQYFFLTRHKRASKNVVRWNYPIHRNRMATLRRANQPQRPGPTRTADDKNPVPIDNLTASEAVTLVVAIPIFGNDRGVAKFQVLRRPIVRWEKAGVTWAEDDLNGVFRAIRGRVDQSVGENLSRIHFFLSLNAQPFPDDCAIAILLSPAHPTGSTSTFSG
jgi:hypothetical protein